MKDDRLGGLASHDGEGRALGCGGSAGDFDKARSERSRSIFSRFAISTRSSDGIGRFDGFDILKKILKRAADTKYNN